MGILLEISRVGNESGSVGPKKGEGRVTLQGETEDCGKGKGRERERV
jgi:hypothetical protein